MKMIRISILLAGILTTSNSFAQQLPPPGTPSVAKRSHEKEAVKKPEKNTDKKSRLSVTAGLGIANYLGDLTRGNTAFQQSSYAGSLGLSYAIAPLLNARFDIGLHNVQGYDSKAGGAHPERNLSFKSKIIEFSLAAEFSFVNLNRHKFSPYLFAGIGAFNFNPHASYGPDGTFALRGLGTEGQGLTGYPGLYSTMAIEYPLGVGFKYAVSNRLILLSEFNYRFTSTDYLDDVSGFYPDKALLDARNPQTSKFTWRGNGSYPANRALKRGDPDNKDGFYTTTLKIAYKIKAEKGKKTEKTSRQLPVIREESDRDNDGLADVYDKCADVAGSKENNGCPFPYIEGGDLASVSVDSMTYRIYFDLDRAILLSEAFKALQGIVAILKADNSLGVNIAGHSDNTGTAAVNMQISEERANITRDYLLTYNIPAEKITTAFYGDTMPLDENQQWRNRRVEITIVKK
ncbi:MAG: OmpA family protein [Ferruginibacter sp.]|nr:OmpA family protein [Ferruginibacter sp.]